MTTRRCSHFTIIEWPSNYFLSLEPFFGRHKFRQFLNLARFMKISNAFTNACILWHWQWRKNYGECPFSVFAGRNSCSPKPKCYYISFQQMEFSSRSFAYIYRTNAYFDTFIPLWLIWCDFDLGKFNVAKLKSMCERLFQSDLHSNHKPDYYLTMILHI